MIAIVLMLVPFVFVRGSLFLLFFYLRHKHTTAEPHQGTHSRGPTSVLFALPYCCWLSVASNTHRIGRRRTCTRSHRMVMVR